MNTGLDAFLSWQFILFSLGIFFTTWILRTVMEFIFKKLVSSNVWENLILPLIPCVIGLIIAHFIISYPYPLGISSLGGRELFGLVSGGMSGLVYRMIKSMVKNQLQSFGTTIIATTPYGTAMNVQNPNNPNTGIGMGQNGV